MNAPCDEKMLAALEQGARHEEYSTVLGIIEKVRGNKITTAVLVKTVKMQTGWPEETIVEIIDDLVTRGAILLSTIQVASLRKRA